MNCCALFSSNSWIHTELHDVATHVTAFATDVVGELVGSLHHIGMLWFARIAYALRKVVHPDPEVVNAVHR